MKLMIEIPNYDYEYITNGCIVPIKIDNHIYEAIRNSTPLDAIIADIEAARDKDKLCEYPYNRCIDILRKTGE